MGGVGESGSAQHWRVAEGGGILRARSLNSMEKSMLQYESDYSNQVHQLTIAVSRHFFVTREGVVKWQMKPFDITLENCQKTGKTHIVNYIIRDHFSGMFYGALAATDKLRDAMEFLVEAWSEKADYPFAGMPEHLIVAKTYQSTFPNLMAFLSQQPIQLIEARSGFQGGVRDVRTWEELLKYPITPTELDESRVGVRGDPTIERFMARGPHALRYACIGVCGDRSKAPKYLSNRRHCRMPAPFQAVAVNSAESSVGNY